MEKALILCEGWYGTTRGKTAAGLIRHSLRFQILGVIDSKTAGRDAGEVLDGRKNGVPIFASVKDALEKLPAKPKWVIVGVATVGGMLPPEFRKPLKDAIRNGISVISGLHEWLSEDKEMAALAKKHKVRIVDIRKEPPLNKMHKFENKAGSLNCVRIPILGTDAACGKRTTAIILTKELNERGVKTTFVATGQTGLLQGSKYGVPLDAIRGDYVVGELEHAILRAYEEERPKIIIIEGQGALSHPAYVTGSRAIVNASQPTTVVLQHAPGRKYRSYHADELHLPNGTIDREMELIKVYANSDVIGIAVNHENLTREQVEKHIAEYEDRYKIPACDPLVDGTGKIADAIIRRYIKKNG